MSGLIKRLFLKKTYTINSNDLTPDCWDIQMKGIKACDSCDVKNTPECGGKAIISKIITGTYPAHGLGNIRPTNGGTNE